MWEEDEGAGHPLVRVLNRCGQRGWAGNSPILTFCFLLMSSPL